MAVGVEGGEAEDGIAGEEATQRLVVVAGAVEVVAHCAVIDPAGEAIHAVNLAAVIRRGRLAEGIVAVSGPQGLARVHDVDNRAEPVLHQVGGEPPLPYPGPTVSFGLSWRRARHVRADAFRQRLEIAIRVPLAPARSIRVTWSTAHATMTGLNRLTPRPAYNRP